VKTGRENRVASFVKATFDRVKGKPGYLRYLPSTWRQIARLLAARPDLEPVRRILGQYVPELRG